MADREKVIKNDIGGTKKEINNTGLKGERNI